MIKLISVLVLVLLSGYLSGCSRAFIRSGHYILLQEGDTFESLGREFNVSAVAIANANHSAPLQPGKWYFIPEKIGFLPEWLGVAPTLEWDNSSLAGGYLMWPLPASARITSYFGEHRDGHNHAGLDISAPLGNYLVAAEEGEVSFSGYEDGGYGEMLIIKHGGEENISTLYGHMSKKLVGINQHVYRGQIIGLVGSTGRSTGPHLHFEVRRNGHAVNPLPYFQSKERVAGARESGRLPAAVN